MDTTRKIETFTQPVDAGLVDPRGFVVAVDSSLGYDPTDPYAVTAQFATEVAEVRWTFARDLLTFGLLEPTGDGDVHVWPCLDDHGRAVVMVELTSDQGEALMQLRTTDVASFVERMLVAVPAGEESDRLNLDGLVSALLATDA
jgi:hypothetical protein